jgi:hypothetical protein
MVMEDASRGLGLIYIGEIINPEPLDQTDLK